MSTHHHMFRHLAYNDTVIYRKAQRSDKNPEAPEQGEAHRPYTGKIVDFTETRIGVRADGWWGHAPLYYVDPHDILHIAKQVKKKTPFAR